MKFKSELDEYCYLVVFGLKQLPISKEQNTRFTELDEIYKHHRISKHPLYCSKIANIQKQFTHFYFKILQKEFDIQEKQQMEIEALEMILNKSNIITTNE